MRTRFQTELILVAIASVVLIAGGECIAQFTIENYDALRHDRFVEDRMGEEFIGTPLNIDLSGVGRVNEGAGRWVTMISPTHFITSNHATAAEGTVTFYTGNDLGGPTMDCVIDTSNGVRIGESDAWLGSLVSSAACDTSSLTYYDIASPADYTGVEVFAVGQSNRAPGERTTAMRAGRNVVSYVETGTYFRGTADHLIYVDDSADGDVSNMPQQQGPERVDSEFRLSNGDSGAPTFVQSVAGGYELLGIHSYLGYDGTRDDDGFSADRWASVDTYMPTDRNAIYDLVKLDDPDFTFVRNLDANPVGDVLDRDLFILESGFDCSLDGLVNEADFNCTQWVGALADIPRLLQEFGVPLGDINLDGTVGFFEFLRLTSNFGEPGQYTDGDFDLSGTIDFSDFLVLARNFGLSTDVAASGAVPIPEPDGGFGLCTLALLLIGIRHLYRENSR